MRDQRSSSSKLHPGQPLYSFPGFIRTFLFVTEVTSKSQLRAPRRALRQPHLGPKTVIRGPPAGTDTDDSGYSAGGDLRLRVDIMIARFLGRVFYRLTRRLICSRLILRKRIFAGLQISTFLPPCSGSISLITSLVRCIQNWTRTADTAFSLSAAKRLDSACSACAYLIQKGLTVYIQGVEDAFFSQYQCVRACSHARNICACGHEWQVYDDTAFSIPFFPRLLLAR